MEITCPRLEEVLTFQPPDVTLVKGAFRQPTHVWMGIQADVFLRLKAPAFTCLGRLTQDVEMVTGAISVTVNIYQKINKGVSVFTTIFTIYCATRQC